jgi:hypothetical protein
VQYFTWEEFLSGSRLLKEEGALVGIGGEVRGGLYQKSLLLNVKGEMFGGEVSYNGQTQSGQPLKTGGDALLRGIQ